MLGLALAAVSMVQAEYTDPPLTPKDRSHWAFRSIRDVEVPCGTGHPIDRFLERRLKAAGIPPEGEADRSTLIRRLTFDLTGLPPTPDEIQAFEADATPGAYEKVVDRLLASKEYGERWAQHWLDLIRFAETEGFEQDFTREEAWRYRDWVIRALNDDVPYDRFLQLQIAGDEIAPGEEDALIATGFIMSGPDMSDVNTMEERRHVLQNDITAMVGQALMGLTFRCAECHDHKYDPISTGDFYRLRAVFSNIGWARKKRPLPAVVDEKNGRAPASFVMIRGQYARPGVEAPPAFPRVLNPEGLAFKAVATGNSSGRRRAFAEWVTRGDHPLTGRVFVNWLWGHHFGRGIVSTPGDFGRQGTPPSHPELLDWLAREAVRRKWSLKKMHRLMVTSAAYRRSSRGARKEGDPENRLLWRMNPRRLEGEAIRDAMLSISGRLNPKRYGPGIRIPLPESVVVTLKNRNWKVTKDESEHRRRSIYLFAKRNLRLPLFDVFDRPAADSPCARRTRSTTATQSLMLFNSEFSRLTSEALAARLRKAGADLGEGIDLAYRLVLGRHPSNRERARASAFLKSNPLEDLCLALFNLNEFVYVD